MGIADDEDLKKTLQAFLRPGEDGHPHRIIEAVSEGVVFSSIEHILHVDYAAVLRPRLTDEQKAGAIARAFKYHGRPYDFEFDFSTSDKLVCTELVYRAYDGMIKFDLVRLMGRQTLPANEIVRKFNKERGREDRELELILFLDTPAGETRARLADVDAFSRTINRPKAFTE